MYAGKMFAQTRRPTLVFKGKCNNIIMDGCKKSAILFESVVSSCEFINCQSIQMQVRKSIEMHD